MPPCWRHLAPIGLAPLVPLTLDGPLTPWLGLVERVYVAIPSVWQVGTGIVALRLLATPDSRLDRVPDPPDRRR